MYELNPIDDKAWQIWCQQAITKAGASSYVPHQFYPEEQNDEQV